MSTLQGRLRGIEQELHTLETATPRNSATVDRGGLNVVDDGSVILEAGGTVFFDEGGSAVSSNYSIHEETGWQIGTERRGTSVVVLNDAPGEDLQVSTANSSVYYEEVALEVGENLIPLNESSMVILQIFIVVDTPGTLAVGDTPIMPVNVLKSQKSQWSYSYMESVTNDVVIITDMPDTTVRVSRLTVNNAS